MATKRAANANFDLATAWGMGLPAAAPATDSPYPPSALPPTECSPNSGWQEPIESNNNYVAVFDDITSLMQTLARIKGNKDGLKIAKVITKGRHYQRNLAVGTLFHIDDVPPTLTDNFTAMTVTTLNLRLGFCTNQYDRNPDTTYLYNASPGILLYRGRHSQKVNMGVLMRDARNLSL